MLYSDVQQCSVPGPRAGASGRLTAIDCGCRVPAPLMACGGWLSHTGERRFLVQTTVAEADVAKADVSA